MRLGLLGLGRIGAFHAETLAGLPAVEELVISDPVPALAEQVAARFGARIAGSPEAVLASGVDGMIIAPPPASTPSSSSGLRGLPTFCEKPVARDSGKAAQLARRVAAAGVQVQIGYPRRFDPAFAAVRAAVADGELGTVLTVRSTTLDPAPPPRAYLAESGGIFRDCAVHDYDAVRWVTGQEVTEVYAAGTNQDAEWFGELGDVHTASAVLTLDGGALQSSPTAGTTRAATTFGWRCTALGTAWRPDWDRGFRCGRPSRACRSRTASRSRSSWTGWPRLFALNWRRSPRWRPVGARHRARSWMRSRPAGWLRPARCRCASTARSRSRKSGSHDLCARQGCFRKNGAPLIWPCQRAARRRSAKTSHTAGDSHRWSGKSPRCGCRPRRAAPERAGCRVLPPPLTENCRPLLQARWHGCRKPPGERAACPRSTA